MTPNQGQGAAMAIEDARALVMALRGGVGGALDRYVNLRAARVRKVQLDSRRIGEYRALGEPGRSRAAQHDPPGDAEHGGATHRACLGCSGGQARVGYGRGPWL